MPSKKLNKSKSAHNSHVGIPDFLTVEFAKNWVKPRMTAKRFAHTQGVASVAERLASALAMDVYRPVLAAWLHDACKEVKDKELVAMAATYGIKMHALEKTNGHILHGPVAAEVIKAELGLSDEGILNAIREHTLGNIAMTPLSQIVFLADCLEDSRPQEYTKPIWQALDIEGKIDLDRAVLMAFDLGLKHLLADRRVIHPRTIDARNYYLHTANNSAPSN